MKETLLFAAMGTGFTFLMTTLGASIVFLLKEKLNKSCRERSWDLLLVLC